MPTWGLPPRSDHQQPTEPCCRTLSLPQLGREVIEADLLPAAAPANPHSVLEIGRDELRHRSTTPWWSRQVP